MGAVIGALAGAFAVLLFRFSQKKAAEKKQSDDKPPVKIDYKGRK